MFPVEFTGDIRELPLEVGEMHSGHRFGINPAPHDMSVPTAFLLVKQDSARLAFKTEFPFDPGNGLLKILDRDTG
jgi:hypothetical protein